MKKKLNNFLKKYIIEIAFILVVVSLLLSFPFIFTRTWGLFSFDDSTGVIGDTIGGITAPLTGLIGSILLYTSLKEQIKANKLTSDNFEKQSLDAEYKYLIENFEINKSGFKAFEDIKQYSDSQRPYYLRDKEVDYLKNDKIYKEFRNEAKNVENPEFLYDNKYNEIIIKEYINKNKHVLPYLISVQLMVEFIYENKFLNDNINLQTKYKKMFFIKLDKGEVNLLKYVINIKVINDKINVFVEDYNNNYNLNIFLP